MLTQAYLRYWHTRYNKLVFGGKLKRIPVVLLEMKDWGQCWGNYIEISPGITNEQARATILHEMIHQWQHENGLPMDHGRSFKQWEGQCLLLTGLLP